MNNNEWIEYDWNFEGASALFGVDMSLVSHIDDLQSTALTMICHSKHDDIKVSEIREYEKQKNKLLRKMGLTYLGFIETFNCVRYYFYMSCPDELSAAQKLTRYIKTISFDCKEDHTHTIYRKLLYPNAAKLQTEENRKLLEQFRQQNDNMSVPRKIKLHLYFPSEPLRILFEEQARLSGYAIGESNFSMEYELPHGVCVCKIASLTKSEIDNVTTVIISVAQKHDGALMYWDAPVVPKRRMI